VIQADKGEEGIKRRDECRISPAQNGIHYGPSVKRGFASRQKNKKLEKKKMWRVGTLSRICTPNASRKTVAASNDKGKGWGGRDEDVEEGGEKKTKLTIEGVEKPALSWRRSALEDLLGRLNFWTAPSRSPREEKFSRGRVLVDKKKVGEKKPGSVGVCLIFFRTEGSPQRRVKEGRGLASN